MAYATTNPFTGEVVKTFPTATRQDIDSAIEQANAAFQDWKQTTPE